MLSSPLAHLEKITKSVLCFCTFRSCLLKRKYVSFYNYFETQNGAIVGSPFRKKEAYFHF